MKEIFNPGDRVEFIDDNQEGTVISIIDNATVLVSIEDGLEIPAKKNQLIRISKSSGESKNITDKYAGLEQKPKPKPDTEKKNKHIYLAITNETDESLRKLYLINESPWTIYFTVFSEKNKQYIGTSNGKLEPDGFQLITTLNTADIDAIPDMHFYALFYHDSFPELPEPAAHTLKVHQKLLVKESNNVELLDKKCIIQSIYTSKREKEKQLPVETIKKQDVQKVSKPEDVIDLHIEKINPNHGIMSRNEIFDYQFNHFVNSLEKAIAFNYDRIVFIHGIGVQSLKSRITDYLKKDKNVKEFRDADIRKFGYGATEVILKKERVFKI